MKSPCTKTTTWSIATSTRFLRTCRAFSKSRTPRWNACPAILPHSWSQTSWRLSSAQSLARKIDREAGERKARRQIGRAGPRAGAHVPRFCRTAGLKRPGDFLVPNLSPEKLIEKLAKGKPVGRSEEQDPALERMSRDFAAQLVSNVLETF